MLSMQQLVPAPDEAKFARRGNWQGVALAELLGGTPFIMHTCSLFVIRNFNHVGKETNIFVFQNF
jgi:hypothetical protein